MIMLPHFILRRTTLFTLTIFEVLFKEVTEQDTRSTAKQSI